MKKILLTLIVFLVSFRLLATDIHGRVMNAETKQPMEFVTVSIVKKDTQKSIAGALTNDRGNFNILSIPKGDYLLRVTFVGYKTINRLITVDNEKLEIGILSMSEDSKTLQEVQVIGQGSQMRFEADKRVFSVDQNIAAAGGSATEALQNIPSVNVDNEGNISLRNNSGVEVWINGKPSGLTADNRAQVLQQLPAESIESIEIMTNPSSKFSPEGTAGIINLVMKKNRKGGYYGTVSAGSMLTLGNKMGYNAGASLNYSKNKLDTYMNLGYRYMTMTGNSYTDRTNFNASDTTLLTQQQTMTPTFGGLFFRAGMDYRLNDKNTVGISGFGMVGNRGGNSFTDYLLIDKHTNTPLRKYSRDNTDTGNHPGYDISVYHKIEFDKKGSNLMTNLSFDGRNMKSDSRYMENRLLPLVGNDDISQSSSNKNNEVELKIDYTKKFNENDKLELGWNNSYETRNSVSEGMNNLTKQAIGLYYNDFSSKEQLYAVYANYAKKFNDRFAVQAGVRGEYQVRQIKTIPSDMPEFNPKPDFQLFPSVFFSYALPHGNEFQLNYTRRVNRPRGRQINSFRDYSNPNVVSYGNPYLMPEYASAFELNYLKNWDNHSLSASVYYRFTDDVIQRVNFMENNLLNSTFFNLTKQQNSGVELVAKNRIFRIINLTSSVNMYYNKLNAAVYNPSPDINVKIDGQENFSWDAKMIANLMLSRTFSAQLTGQYIAPQIIPQGKMFEMYSVDFGLRKTFFDRNLTLALTGRDIFNTRKTRTTTSGVGFVQNYETIMAFRMGGGRMIGLNVTYAFGNMKPKKQDQNRNPNQEMNMGDD